MRAGVRPALSALVIAVAPALAGAACEDAGDDIATIACLEGEYHMADDALNRLWLRVLAETPSGGDPATHREAIRDAQRAWIAFRDADCVAASMVGIPRYWEINRLHCAIDHTRARTAALAATYLD